ncbi:MAG: beta family protein [Nitrospira sp.]|nr:beta family protein [Nitrospira sp.]
MNFGPDHYVPVLKVKRGERKALQRISSAYYPRITPLLEIVKRKPGKTLRDHLNTTFTDLSDTVRPYPRCLLDARELVADGQAGAEEVFRRASAAGIIFTPVTGISRTVDLIPAFANRANGLALRLTRAEFERGGLAGRINSFLDRQRIAPEEIDLIIDLGGVESLIVEGIEALTNAFLAEIPSHQRWRTFTVSSCSFPLSMSVVQRNSDILVERSDWVSWRGNLYGQRTNLERLPTFSDCVIQRPEGVEDFDPVKMQVSASIRYTVEEEWLLIKGESTRSKRPGEQFPALAHKLVDGSLRARFYGAGHCSGCKLMKAAADGGPGLGSAEAWRQLGTIHHISVATQAIASLAWP